MDDVPANPGSNATQMPTPAACGHPTRNVGPCRRPPLGGGAGRCSRHAGLPSTKAERDAAKRAALKHGYYLSGFLDDAEKELFQRVCDGQVEPGDIVRQMTAAMYIRVMRMTLWESEDGEASPLTTAAFAELRQALQGPGSGALRNQVQREAYEQEQRDLAGVPR